MEYKDRGEFRLCEWRSDVYTETGVDYSLPDYNGDVRKVLYTEAKVRPSGNFENGENVDFLGIIVYNMVYSDSENKINSISFTSDYDFSVRCNSDNCVSSFADTQIAAYSVRLLGPRKLSAKATLSSRIIFENKESYHVSGTAFESGTPEVKSEDVNIAGATVSESLEREYAEEILRLDGRVADEVEVILTDAECVIESVNAENEGVQIKGSMLVSALVKCEGEPIQRTEKSLRIDESIPMLNAASAMRILPRVTVSSARCSINADESGCSVIANVIADLAVECYGNDCVSLITDAYRCDCDTKNEYGEYKFYELATAMNDKEDISSTVAREESETEGVREIICLGSSIKVNETSFEEGICNISGEVNYSGIGVGFDEKGNLSYQPFKQTVDFVKNVNINCQIGDKIKLIPSFNCTNASVTLDEDNIYMGCRAQMKLIVLAQRHIQVLNSSELVADGEYEQTGSVITVYYPESGETLFDIAKKFHTTVEKIAGDNSVKCASVSESDGGCGVKRLVIL